MKLSGFADNYRVDPSKNRVKIPKGTDPGRLGEMSDDGTSILYIDVDHQDNDLYIDGVSDTQWVIGYGYGSTYRCLGVFDNFFEALEVLEAAKEDLIRFAGWFTH